MAHWSTGTTCRTLALTGHIQMDTEADVWSICTSSDSLCSWWWQGHHWGTWARCWAAYQQGCTSLSAPPLEHCQQTACMVEAHDKYRGSSVLSETFRGNKQSTSFISVSINLLWPARPNFSSLILLDEKLGLAGQTRINYTGQTRILHERQFMWQK